MNEYFDLIALAKSTARVGVLQDANATGEATNASCGDACQVSLRIVDGTIVDLRYESTGCIISRASAAVLAAQCPLALESVRVMHGNAIRALLDVPVSSLRERCLTTALAAVQNAVHTYDA